MKKYTNKLLLLISIVIIISTVLLVNIVHNHNGNKLNFSVIWYEHMNNMDTQKILRANIKDFNQSCNVRAVKINGSGKLIIKNGQPSLNMNRSCNSSYCNLSSEVFIENGVLNVTNFDDGDILVLELPQLESLEVFGSSKTSIEAFSEKQLSIKVYGSGNVEVKDSAFSTLNLTTSGASSLKFINSTLNSILVNFSGATNLDIDSFHNGILSGQVSGAGKIEYSGNLLKNDVNRSGAFVINEK